MGGASAEPRASLGSKAQNPAGVTEILSFLRCLESVSVTPSGLGVVVES